MLGNCAVQSPNRILMLDSSKAFYLKKKNRDHVTEMKWNFLLCTILVFFTVRRTSPTYCDDPQCTNTTEEAPNTIRFAPALRVQSSEVVVAASSLNFCRRRLSILRLSQRSLLSIWLLLLAGDVEVNPGPRGVRHPCGVCSKAVRSNQKTILCEVCYYWLHTRCIGMLEPEYLDLQNSDEPWCCSTCFKEALPFRDVSCLNSTPTTSTDISESASSGVSEDNRHPCSILYSNCRSLLPKLDSLRVRAAISSPDIIALTETWLDHSLSNSELFIPGYVIVRRDRNRHGGGVLAYIKDSIAIVNSAAHDVLELLQSI